MVHETNDYSEEVQSNAIWLDLGAKLRSCMLLPIYGTATLLNSPLERWRCRHCISGYFNESRCPMFRCVVAHNAIFCCSGGRVIYNIEHGHSRVELVGCHVVCFQVLAAL